MHRGKQAIVTYLEKYGYKPKYDAKNDTIKLAGQLLNP